MDINLNEVIEFWDWFEFISSTQIIDSKNLIILKELDLRIKRLGAFEWEVGPIDNDRSYLAISPNLNKELLRNTSEIISMAPNCANWVFFHAKPRKDYTSTWSMINEYGKTILIDSNSWSYVLYYFNDGTFDIDLKVGDIAGGILTQNLAVDIALTNSLGEEKYIQLIKNVNVVNEFESNAEKQTLLKHLYDHIVRILS